MNRFLILLATIVFLTESCRNNNPEAGRGPSYNYGQPAAQKEDAAFLADAYTGGLFEMESADKVKKRLGTKDAKELANAMWEAHRDINNRIKNLAAQKNISLPGGLSKEQQDKLLMLDSMGERGATPDKAYAQLLVTDHTGAAALFERASKNAKDSDIRKFFAEKTTEINHHLEMATTLRDNLK